jgi:hypothetical protein
MQTNKEFIDALDIQPEDGFLAVAVRRAAAWQLGKEVVNIDTETVDEPDFCLPWDGKEFAFALEKELGITIPISETNFSNELISIEQDYPDWFRGPAIKMPMKQWTEIAVKRFLRPVREKITCPKDWTPFEPITNNESVVGSNGCVQCVLFVLGLFFIFYALFCCYYKIYSGLIFAIPFTIIFWKLFFCLFSPSQFLKRTQPVEVLTEELPSWQLLGTMTFHSDTLQFADNDRIEETATILSGDYRLFLTRMGKEEDFTPELAVLTTQKEPRFRADFESSETTRIFEIVIDSGLITVMEKSETSSADWIPAPTEKVVYRILQREDLTICGIKFIPTYGDGFYKIIIDTSPTNCSIMIELQTLAE